MPGIATTTKVDTRPLLAAGVLATIAYAAGDLVGGLHWKGYSFFSTTISELSAIASPSRPIVVPLFMIYTLCTLIFGVGVWVAARGRALYVVGAMIIGVGLVDIVGPSFPIHLRGVEPTTTDAMHVVATSLTVALILGSLVAGAIAFRGWFRVYSLITLAVLIAGGVVTGTYGNALAAGGPTPGLGLIERIMVHGSMLWNAMLAILLLRAAQPVTPLPQAERSATSAAARAVS